MSFGTKIDGRNYRERVGAYAVAFDEQGRVALVEAPAFRDGEPWLFLPGGGIEAGESDEACILRECLEETGCAVQVGEYIGMADEYLTSLKRQEYMHLAGHFYKTVWGEKAQEPIEEDHTLVWVPVEDCYERMFCKYQVWAVKTAWERRGRWRHMNIRAFQDADYERGQGLLETVQTYHVEQRPDLYKETKDFVARAHYSTFLHRPEELSAIAEIDGVIAGICLVSLEEQGSDHPVLMPRRYGSIEVLCIHSAFRRQGVAEALIGYVKARAKELELNGLDLSVAAFNFPAKTLYEKLDFMPRSYKMEWKIEKEIEQ